VPEKKIFQEEEKNMKKIGYFFKKGRKKRRKRTFKPGGLFHYQIKADIEELTMVGLIKSPLH
ncbi:MAG: hypothetical protein GY710_15645, partial [Desulfobacteraceae bacterium]|nr:hypothetical protein [Desulfobacteraceae bacterium]